MDRSESNGFGLLSLIITITIIVVLSGIIMKYYFGNQGTPAQSVHQGSDALDQARQINAISDQKNRELDQELNK